MGARGGSNGNTTLTEDDVLKLRQTFLDGSTVREIADAYSLSVSATERILSGRTWAYLTGGTNLLRRKRISPTNPTRKLTWEQAQALRKFSPYCSLSQRQWAALLNVDQRTVSNILTGKLYQREDDQ
jgi:hypothetical protein